MATSFVLRLVGRDDVVLDFFSGFVVRGIFFKFLSSVDERLADRVHERRSLSPYSVSGVEALNGRFLFRGQIPAGSSFTIKMTALDDVVADALYRCLLTNQTPTVKVNNVESFLSEIAVKTWSPLQNIDVDENVKFLVYFRSPTYFRNTQKNLPFLTKLIPKRFRKPVRPVYRYNILPEPYHFFRNLARLYRQFGDPSFPYKSFSEWLLEGGVALENYHGLRVYKIYDDRGRWSRGFVGKVVYTIPSDLYDSRFARLVVNMLEFARFSNVGGNRTAGFGVVDYTFLQPEPGEDE